ncbi:MAG TPA: hypothetical protein DDX92_06185 [Flavobacteriales bacterium]|jgi:hypothetical protein|nr:hypothetical protein [Flavobacteriales bacterium]
MKLFYRLALISIAVMILGSCYPTFERSVEEYDIVGTIFDTETDFTQKTTFILEDDVRIIWDTLGNEEPPEYSAELLNGIVSSTKQNLLSYGWVEAAPNDTPDVHISTAITTVDVNGTIWYPGYPWWGWGGYYPWYPGGGVAYYSYSTGTVFIDMVDVDRSLAENRPTIVWNTLINGLVSSYESNNIKRVDDNINQAFTQSPYLNKN